MLGWKYDYGPFLLGPRVGAPPALTRGRAGKLFSPFPRIRTLTATFVNPVPAIGASVVQFRCTVTLRELCQGHVPEPVLRRMDENGFIQPTEVQQQGLPVLFTGSDCVLHAQTGSGKTLTYLLLVYSIINTQRSAVQALIVVPTRELGMQVTKVARMLAAKPSDFGSEQQKSCTVMALLDGGLLKRHKTWLKADPPTIVVATVASLCQMLEKHVLDLGSMRVLVVDEVDFMFNSSKQVSSLRKLLTSYSSSRSRQTVFASASIPQHRRFLHDCVQQKWTKICPRSQRFQAIFSLLQFDLPESAILFVNEQSEKSKKAGDIPTTTLLIEHLKSSCEEFSNISLLEEDQNFNSRAASLFEVRKKSCYLIVATDLAARGVDLPETTHIYNFDLPKSAVHYLHRAGRAGRKPFSDAKCIITSIIAPEEHFVLQRFEHELKFNCEELFL
ncbi:DEAD-box ATP-dependent RNA helicase 58, chloroplastic-like isoform X2 [Chenopodium quinoa]|uniref:DEAD-box ATP-dependent RNA helicase 58, chloroplastic-like isoform X2 n=1 Tax=Chenopodium quinoa TaxID=63459 RepID=UPI000B7989A8|nr:DEAD-box ATP-dependent RNA helicase 58, chloroplastic-like isoform X2 [Chenopodium quinoa]